MSYVETFWTHMKQMYDRRAVMMERVLPDRTIDEMSIYFKNEEDLQELIRLTDSALYVQHFDSQLDIVQQMIDGKFTDDSASFGVRFEFFQEMGTHYRCEAMFITDGWSPVHNELRHGEIAHASFKCKDQSDYSMACLELVQKNFKQIAEFRNSYGLFSYFTAEFDGAPYIKPRVNLRDA